MDSDRSWLPLVPIFHQEASLSSIWSQQSPPTNASSPNSRTYANVLRRHDDPLMKIRQLGTKGSQDLSESSSETTSDVINFSSFHRSYGISISRGKN
jgi:hypothetical protein